MKFNIFKALLITLLVCNFSVRVYSETLGDTVFKFLNGMLDKKDDELKPLRPIQNMNRRTNRNRGINNKITQFRFKSMDREEPAVSGVAPSGSAPAPSSPVPSGSSPLPNQSNSAPQKPNSYYVDLNDPNSQISDWLTISSPAFANRSKYPTLMNKDGFQALIDLSRYQRINGNYAAAKLQGATMSTAFWFKVRGGYIYYSSTKEDINVLDAIFAKKVEDSQVTDPFSNNHSTCFDVTDFDNNVWNICALDEQKKLIFMCSSQKYLGQALDYSCIPPEEKLAKVTLIPPVNNIPKVERQRVVQPVIVIPMASKACNEKWDYLNKGGDWECTCKEGLEQSPIDLPIKDEAIQSPLKPMFQYELISAQAKDSTLDGILTGGKQVLIRYEKGAIRLFHPNMGKIVTIDGGVYVAEEISFHTPSEHKINGKQYDMEMQIVHFGRTKGDIAKQIILSFLFKMTPGVYNKFIDRLDFFNLPNPIEKSSELFQDFYIPSVFFTTEEDDIPSMQPFSFYTYEGSLTMPPCTERTTHFVAADPLPLSNTVITLFKEALKKPDVVNENDPNQIVLNDEGVGENNRQVQPLNGRKVFIYDHRRYGCAEFKQKKRDIKPAGHYEKLEKDATEYIFVAGNNPSGLPGSFVVSEKEAKGSS
jgi:carbonic anhydrase